MVRRKEKSFPPFPKMKTKFIRIANISKKLVRKNTTVFK